MFFFVVVVEALAGYGTPKKSRKLSQHSNESRRDRQSRRLTIEKLLIDAKRRAKARRAQGRVALG